MSNLYFGEDVDQAIALFLLETVEEKKHEIFIDEIKPAFDKLINYHYFRVSAILNQEDLKHDCLSFLYEVLRNAKFNPEKYTRGFPYFNMVVKNFFIQKLKANTKKVNSEKNVSSLSDYSSDSNLFDTVLLSDNIEEGYETREFINILKENLPKWRDQFSKDQEKKFVDALILLFENAENIDIYNKKAIFFYLREITSLNSKQIATNMHKVKKKFVFLKKKYQRGDI